MNEPVVVVELLPARLEAASTTTEAARNMMRHWMAASAAAARVLRRSCAARLGANAKIFHLLRSRAGFERFAAAISESLSAF